MSRILLASLTCAAALVASAALITSPIKAEPKPNPTRLQDAGDGMGGMGEDNAKEPTEAEKRKAERKEERRIRKGKGRAKSTRDLPKNYMAPGKPGVPDRKTSLENKKKEIENISKLIGLDADKTQATVDLAVEAEDKSIDLREHAAERYTEIEEYARELMADLCDVKDDKVDVNYMHLSINAARQPSTRWVTMDPTTKEVRPTSFTFLCEELGLEHDDVRPVIEDLQNFIQQDDPYTIWTQLKEVRDEGMVEVKNIFSPEEYITFMVIAGLAKPEGDEIVMSRVYMAALGELKLSGAQAVKIQGVYADTNRDYSVMRKKIESELDAKQLEKLNKKLEREGLLNSEDESADVKE